MKEPLAWLNLVHQKARSAVAVAGVTFAILLIFMQLGFCGAAEGTATIIYDELDFDLVLISPQYIDINRAGTFPLDRLYLARSAPEVDQAVPLYITFGLWRNPEETGSCARMPQNILIIGLDLTEVAFCRSGKRIQEAIDRHRETLQHPGMVLIDSCSHREFGPKDTGQVTEIGTHRVEIAGQFALGTGFGANGLLLVSDGTFFKVAPAYSRDRASLGLLRLRPGTNPQAVAQALRGLLPPDVRVLARDEIVGREKQYWVGQTSIGVIFFMGVLVAFFVGVVFVYQVIATDIKSRLHEYATLKAMGYDRRYLASVVLQQAVLIALLGYVPGLVLSLGLYELARGSTGIPIGMTLERAGFVLALAVVMCSLSGLLSLRKLQAADPADLF